MKERINEHNVEKKKVIAIWALFLSSAAIVLLGISFCLYSYLNNVEYKVLSSKIPGEIFGVIIAFLGVRYFLSVRKLKTEVYKTASRFSWSNFKKKEE